MSGACLELAISFGSKMEISWSRVIAFNSDNCSVMKGHRNGVIAKIRAVNPKVIDVGCICHMANLAVGKAMKKSLFNLDDLVSDVFNHFSSRWVVSISMEFMFLHFLPTSYCRCY